MPASVHSPRLLDPKNDYVFKRLLADSPTLLSSLINAVRHDRPPVAVEAVLNPAIAAEELGDKAIVLDMLVRDTVGRRFNVEMQAWRDANWVSRSVFYIARALGRQVAEGEPYNKLRPAIGVHLLDYSLFDAPDQADWCFELRDRRRPSVALGEEIELNLLELPKAAALANLPQAMSDWATFFERWNEETAMNTIEDPAVRAAQRKLETLSQSESEWAYALMREKGRQVAASLELQAREAREEGLAKGREQGREQGREEGRIAGESLLLLRLLTRRFGALADDVTLRVQSADSATLERWSDRLLEVDCLEKVFREE